MSLFNLRQNDEFGILEVGMDKKGEIDYLSKIIELDVGVITNINYAHAKNFKNIKQIALAKSEIIKNIKPNGYIVLNADDSFFHLHKKIAIAEKIKTNAVQLFRYSALTFNGHRIHYDRTYATEVEGYPGLVVHGPLMATMLSLFAERQSGRKLRKFSFRGKRPIFDLDGFTLTGSFSGKDSAELRVLDHLSQLSMSAEAEFL